MQKEWSLTPSSVKQKQNKITPLTSLCLPFNFSSSMGIPATRTGRQGARSKLTPNTSKLRKKKIADSQTKPLYLFHYYDILITINPGSAMWKWLLTPLTTRTWKKTGFQLATCHFFITTHRLLGLSWVYHCSLRRKKMDKLAQTSVAHDNISFSFVF